MHFEAFKMQKFQKRTLTPGLSRDISRLSGSLEMNYYLLIVLRLVDKYPIYYYYPAPDMYKY